MANILENEQYQIARYNFIRKQESYITGLYFDSKGFFNYRYWISFSPRRAHSLAVRRMLTPQT